MPRLLLLLALVLVGCGGAYGGLAAFRIARAYGQLMEGKSLLLTAESTLEGEGLGASPQDVDEAEGQLLAARERFRSARHALQSEPLVEVGRRLPWLGGQLDAVIGLAKIGVAGSEIGLAGVEILREFNSVKQREAVGVGETAVIFLESVEPRVDVVDAKVAAIETIREEIDAPLLQSLAGVVDTVDEGVVELRELMGRYHHARSAAPAMLGFEGPKRYLVLGQDNTELFPSGGIIALYGTVTFDQGRLAERSFHSGIDLVDEWRARGGEYVQPPRPLDDYLLHGWTWNFVLANWSPDFPTAARQALWFYEQAGGEPVDGVIGIDFVTLERLLAITGPLALDEYGLTLDSTNVTEQVLVHTVRPQRPGDHPYAVAVAAASRILEAAFALENERTEELMQSLDGLAREKHLFVYERQGQVEAAVRGLGWDGGLAPLASDYLMAVEASVHSTKLNLVVERKMQVRVVLDEAGGARTEVRLEYHNGLDGWARGRDPGLVSALMLDGFYGGYLRLLAPPRAQLSEVRMDGRPVGVEEVTREGDRASFGRYFPLARGSERQVSFAYRVPDVVTRAGGQREYRLYVQKQGGLGEPLLNISVALPAGARVRWVSLDGERLAGAPLSLETDLAQDRELVVRFEE